MDLNIRNIFMLHPCCQEIDIDSALACFGNAFQIIVTWDLNTQHKIGTAVVVNPLFTGLKVHPLFTFSIISQARNGQF